MWINSSVRGPFLPAYLHGAMHWTEALTRKLTESVKLVGATINCGGGYFHPDPQPHVQSYAVAMDAVSAHSLSIPSSRFRIHLILATRAAAGITNKQFSLKFVSLLHEGHNDARLGGRCCDDITIVGAYSYGL